MVIQAFAPGLVMALAAFAALFGGMLLTLRGAAGRLSGRRAVARIAGMTSIRARTGTAAGSRV